VSRARGRRAHSARRGHADDTRGVDGRRRPDAAAVRHVAGTGRHGPAPEGARVDAEPRARRAGARCVPQPLAQLAARRGARRQGRGEGVHDVCPLSHGREDLVVSHDARKLGEAPRLPPLRGADGRPSDARDALGTRGRRRARLARAEASLRQGVVGAAAEPRRHVGGVRRPTRQRDLSRRGQHRRCRQRGIPADRKRRLRGRHDRNVRRRGDALRRVRASHAHEERRKRGARRIHRPR
jgi:hypothetical protein